MRYAVVQTQFRQIPLEQYVEVFERVPWLTRTDALQQAGRACGLIARQLTEEEAHYLAATCVDYEISAEVAPERSLPKLKPVWAPPRLAVAEEGVTITNARGEGARYGWGLVEVLAFGVVSDVTRDTRPRLRRRPGMMAGATVEKPARPTNRAREALLELHVRDEPVRYRLVARHLADALRRPELRPHAAEDELVRLAETCAGHCWEAAVNAGVDRLVRAGERRDYRSMRQFENELIWLHWRRLRLDG